MVIYLHCSNNNKATTVLTQFREAVATYVYHPELGVTKASKCRSCKVYATRTWCRQTKCVGRCKRPQSTHREIVEGCFCSGHSLILSLFHYMEQDGQLDSLDSVHLYSLHYIYLPRINQALKAFITGWNKHNISKTGGNSPLKLYTRELVRLQKSNQQAFDFYTHVPSSYGAGTDDNEGEFVSDQDSAVHIPPIDINLDEHSTQILTTAINPLSHTYSDVDGIDLYEHTLISLVTALLNPDTQDIDQ